MMKLTTMKKLVDTLTKEWESPIADQILEKWNHDPDSLFYVRSSANFVFKFKENGQLRYLRFNSTSERSRKETENEMEILCFLNEKTPNIVKPILSKNNRYVEIVKTEIDDYIAVVFDGYGGKMYEVEDLSEDQFYTWGKTLGKLHGVMDQIPQELVKKRKTWQDHLDFVKDHIPVSEKVLLKEIEAIRKWAQSSNAKRGLIHYDFELDNLHWYSDTIKIFDFDDSSVYWYGADIAYALRDLFNGKIDTDNPHYKRFMAGYESEFEVDENLDQDLHMFMKLHQLYSYPRILRSLDYKTNDEAPNWIKGLTEKLTNYSESLKASVLNTNS